MWKSTLIHMVIILNSFISLTIINRPILYGYSSGLAVSCCHDAVKKYNINDFLAVIMI